MHFPVVFVVHSPAINPSVSILIFTLGNGSPPFSGFITFTVSPPDLSLVSFSRDMLAVSPDVIDMYPGVYPSLNAYTSKFPLGNVTSAIPLMFVLSLISLFIKTVTLPIPRPSGSVTTIFVFNPFDIFTVVFGTGSNGGDVYVEYSPIGSSATIFIFVNGTVRVTTPPEVVPAAPSISSPDG